MSEYRLSSTVYQVILAGIRQGWGQTKTLEVYRELGGSIRDADFFRLWRETWETIDSAVITVHDKQKT